MKVKMELIHSEYRGMTVSICHHSVNHDNHNKDNELSQHNSSDIREVAVLRSNKGPLVVGKWRDLETMLSSLRKAKDYIDGYLD
tara:strand:- start:155 stop:406 length:252 start_codon:yes stop_codon:yes gene_type:complete